MISSAYESQYDHPSEEVLESFGERGIETYWTATHGTVVFESDGESITVEPESEESTDPLELREELSADESAAALASPASVGTKALEVVA